MVVLWLSSNVPVWDQHSCSMLNLVSIGTDNFMWIGKPIQYVTNHPGQLSLVIPPAVGRVSTCIRWSYHAQHLISISIIWLGSKRLQWRLLQHYFLHDIACTVHAKICMPLILYWSCWRLWKQWSVSPHWKRLRNIISLYVTTHMTLPLVFQIQIQNRMHQTEYFYRCY